MEITLPAALILSLATALATFAASWGVVRYQGHQHDKRLAEIEIRLQRQGDDLSAFKLEAARRFVTDEMLARLEGRVIDAINRLTERLDKVIESRA